MKQVRFNLWFWLLLCNLCSFVNASSVDLPNQAIVQTSNNGIGNNNGGGKNPVLQLANYVKDSVVRMKDGSVELYTNHKQCNSIRSKQKDFLAKAALLLPESERKAATKYRASAGGVTYEEFDFLQKGKDDRGKLANVVFMMVFAPNFVPYAFMFFPEMLPSPFAMNSSVGFNKIEMISRERTHAVLHAMIDIERSTRVAPLLSNLNPFGKNKQKRTMENLERLANAGGALLSADGAVGPKGAELIVNVLKDEIYTKEKPKKDRTSLTILPKPIVKGLGRAMEAPASNQFLPTFLMRGKVLNALVQIKASDEFLVDQDVDLDSLHVDLLQDACSKRLIGGPARTKKEMIDALSNWLDLSVREPAQTCQESGLHYNDNLLRAALLSYNAVDASRDPRSSSYLTRVMYQGQMYSNGNGMGVRQLQVKQADGVTDKWFNKAKKP